MAEADNSDLITVAVHIQMRLDETPVDDHVIIEKDDDLAFTE